MQKASLLPSKVPMVDRRRKEHGKKGSRPIVLLCGANGWTDVYISEELRKGLCVTL